MKRIAPIIYEAKKEYELMLKIDKDHEGTPMRITLPDPIKSYDWFKKWFGGSS